MNVGLQLATPSLQTRDSIQQGLIFVQLRRLDLNRFERAAAGSATFQPSLGVRQRTARRLPCRRLRLGALLDALEIFGRPVERPLRSNGKRVVRREAVAKFLRVVGALAQRILGVNARHGRLPDIFERRNDRVRICGSLAQHPQLLGGSGRQKFDRVERRRAEEASGERRLRGNRDCRCRWECGCWPRPGVRLHRREHPLDHALSPIFIRNVGSLRRRDDDRGGSDH
jgi:hypothetical protein